MDINELASDVAERYDMDPDAARDITRIYVGQMRDAGDDVGEDITGEQAAFVMEAVRRGGDGGSDQLMDDLADMSARLDAVQDEMSDLASRRNDIVVKLLSRGVPAQRIASIAGIARSRVYAIKDARR